MASKLIWNGEKVKRDVRQAEQTGLSNFGETVRDKAYLLAPVDKGDLQDSIQVQQVEPVPTRSGYSLDVGSDDPNVPYALEQELGSVEAAKLGGLEEGEAVNPAKKYTPYMLPALDEERDRFAVLVGKSMPGAYK